MTTLPQTPAEIPGHFADAWNARDPETLAGLFSEDADFVNVVGLWWDNRKDIKRAHAYGLEKIFAKSTLKPGRTKVRQINGSTAVVHARWHLKGQTDKAGNLLEDRRTVMVFVAQKTPEGWIVVACQNTDIVPGKETFAARDGKLQAENYRD